MKTMSVSQQKLKSFEFITKLGSCLTQQIFSCILWEGNIRGYEWTIMYRSLDCSEYNIRCC